MDRVRFAPSPTGYVHLGSLRTALYDYMFAKKNNGKYVLRIEDTDRTRLVDDAIDNLLSAFEWAGIMHDEGPFLKDGKLVEVGEYGPYVQSERLGIYRKYVDQLLESGDAYYCFCSKERLDAIRNENKEKGIIKGYDGHCRCLDKKIVEEKLAAGEPYVVRLKMPKDRELVFDDLVRGTVKMNTSESDDQVLLKADGFPTYHMAVVVDDYLMKITHMIRGEEWLPSTPKQIILYEALGWPVPKFAHLPNILNTEKKKLSKRHDSVAVEDFKKKGYLPEALINFLALVGWSPEGDKEIMNLEEMIEEFSFERVSKSAGVFDVKKLNWMNNKYIQAADDDRLAKMAMEYLIEDEYIKREEYDEQYEIVKRITALVKEKLDYVAQITELYPLFIGSKVAIEDEEALEVIRAEHIPELLEALITKLDSLEEFEASVIKKAFKEISKETGYKGKMLFMPARVSITGEVHGSDLMETISILGKEKTISRIKSIKEKYL